MMSEVIKAYNKRNVTLFEWVNGYYVIVTFLLGDWTGDWGLGMGIEMGIGNGK